jgi:hypothetical protein
MSERTADAQERKNYIVCSRNPKHKQVSRVQSEADFGAF